MSNLLKQCFVGNSTEGKRIINSNQRMEEYEREHLAGGSLPQNGEDNTDAGALEEEILPTHEEEKARLEQFRKEMIK